MRWRMVISDKPSRRGEAFIMYGEKFVMKVYRVSNTIPFANHVVDLLNKHDEAMVAQQKENADAL